MKIRWPEFHRYKKLHPDHEVFFDRLQEYVTKHPTQFVVLMCISIHLECYTLGCQTDEHCNEFKRMLFEIVDFEEMDEETTGTIESFRAGLHTIQ